MKNRARLKEIKISGYKSLGTDTQPIRLEMSNLNIIIGANGARKSNFISFFRMLANMMTGALQIYVGKNGSSESLLQFGSKQTKMISASLVFQNDRFTDTYEFSLVKAVNDTLIFAEEVIDDGAETSPSKRIIKCINCFDKANVGVDVLEKIGIENIAGKCRHFAEWMKRIEARI